MIMYGLLIQEFIQRIETSDSIYHQNMAGIRFQDFSLKKFYRDTDLKRLQFLVKFVEVLIFSSHQLLYQS